MQTVTSALPTPHDQAERLIELGVHDIAGLPADRLRNITNGPEGALVVVLSNLVPASKLVPLLRVNGKQGFVVTDMSDVDVFAPISAVTLPDTPVYLVHDIDRGDAMANWSPDEALPAIGRAGRTEMHRRSAGAGPATDTPGWDSRRPRTAVRYAGRSFRTPWAASTNGSTIPSHAAGSDENSTWPVGSVSKLDPPIAA